MPFDATTPNLDVLLLAAALQLELSQRDHRVAEKRYQLTPEYLQRPGSRLRDYMSTAKIYAQGSRAIGATIVHGAADDRFDLDAILEFATPPGWGPGKVLDELYLAFQGFPDVKTVVRCTRCVQLQFAFMHLDVTPMDPATEPRLERVGDIYHSRNGETDKRLPVNPYGFAGWFRGQLAPASQAFIDNARALRARLEVKDRLVPGVIVADADIDDLPDLVDPIRDAPQVIALKLMKRYLNLRYAARDMKRPVSVYLSKIAVLVGPSPYGLCGQLVAYAKELDRRMTAALETGRRPDERNPAFSGESFNDRWPKDTMEMQAFRGDLRHLVREIERARQSELTEIRKVFDELFGETVSGRAVQGYMDGVSGRPGPTPYERGKGFVAAPAILAPASVAAAPISRAPSHHFHSGLLR